MKIRHLISTLVALAAFSAVVVPTAVGAQATPTCNGRPATIVGTEGDDIITGTRGVDVIVGLGGNDRIRGGRGADIICGGRGRDRIWGQAGADVIFGEGGNDRIDGGNSTDLIYGGNGFDRLIGGPANDVLIGGGDRDRVDGRDGDDTCTLDTADNLPEGCEGGNYRLRTGTGDTVVTPNLRNSHIVTRHCFEFSDRCDDFYVARVRLDGAGSFDALNIHAFNSDGDQIASYGNVGDTYGGVFLFSERPQAIEVDSGGGSWSIMFVDRDGVDVGRNVDSGVGNQVYLVRTPLTGLVTASAEWTGQGQFSVVTVSAAEGRDLAVNEVRFGAAPPFTATSVTKSGIGLVQVISDEGTWSVRLEN
jgi:Ca2+-binding RTX toxin-like protein